MNGGIFNQNIPFGISNKIFKNDPHYWLYLTHYL